MAAKPTTLASPSPKSYDSDCDSSCSSSSATILSLLLLHRFRQATQGKPSRMGGNEALRSMKGSQLSLDHFKLLRRVGSGDIGNVYLCQMRNLWPYAALFLCHEGG
ncbi:unnamed protein product [Rhodiola kirilowii]